MNENKEVSNFLNKLYEISSAKNSERNVTIIVWDGNSEKFTHTFKNRECLKEFIDSIEFSRFMKLELVRQIREMHYTLVRNGILLFLIVLGLVFVFSRLGEK